MNRMKNKKMKAASDVYDNVLIRTKIKSGEFKAVNKRSRSRVWNVFSKVVDQNGIELKNVICRTCLSVFKFQGSTSNLVRHTCYKNAIEQFDPNESARDMQISKPNSCNLSDSTREQEYEIDTIEPLDEPNGSDGDILEDESKEKLANTLVEWAVENCRPLDIFEDSGLRKLATLLIEIGANFGGQLNVEELMPEPATILSNIDDCYQDIAEKVRLDVCEARRNGYSITCHSWTDNCMNYMCVSVHYVKEGSLVSRLLTATALDEETCTGSRVKSQIERILDDFQCVLGEDDPLIVTSTESIVSAPHDDGIIPCISYLLNSIIERAFNEVGPLKEMLNQAKRLLQKSGAVTSLENPLIGYSPKKWNRIYHVLNSIEANRTDILNESYLKQIGNDDFNDISSVVTVLRHFEKCCNTLQDETKPTLHLVIPHIHRLRKLCNSSSRTQIESNLKLRLTDLLEALVRNHIGIYHKMAMFLFPPTNQLLQCTQIEKDQTIEECKTLMKRFGTLDNENADMEVKIKQELEDDLFLDFVSLQTSEDRIQKEIRRYSDLQVPLSDGYDVLNWWHSNRDNFPLLYGVSCRVLGTPATSALSETACAKAQHLLTGPSYNRVSQHDVINKIMFLHKNAKAITTQITIEL